MDANLQALTDIQMIGRLKARYFRALDTKDWDSFTELFTDDARIDLSEDHALFTAQGFTVSMTVEEIARDVVGARKLADFIASMAGPAITAHHGHMPEIDIMTAETAQGIWAMTDIVEYPHMKLHGQGHYHETYRRIGDHWYIATMRLSRLNVDFFRPDGNGGWQQCPKA